MCERGRVVGEMGKVKRKLNDASRVLREHPWLLFDSLGLLGRTLHVIGHLGAQLTDLQPLDPGQHDLLHPLRVFPGDASMYAMSTIEAVVTEAESLLYILSHDVITVKPSQGALCWCRLTVCAACHTPSCIFFSWDLVYMSPNPTWPCLTIAWGRVVRWDQLVAHTVHGVYNTSTDPLGSCVRGPV